MTKAHGIYRSESGRRGRLERLGMTWTTRGKRIEKIVVAESHSGRRLSPIKLNALPDDN